MKKTNIMVKAFFYTGLALWVLLQGYSIGLIAGGAGLSIVLACWSVFKPLPLFVAENMWLLYLLSGIPFGIYSVLFISRGLIRSSRLKQDKKQGNGNQ